MIIANFTEYEIIRKGTERDPLIVGWDDGESILTIPINVRVEIQNTLFYSKTQALQLCKFNKWCWDHLQRRCEETNTVLPFFSIKYFNYILSRAAHPEKSTDPRNINILTLISQEEWKNGDRERMMIYWSNQQKSIRLNKEYIKLRPKIHSK